MKINLNRIPISEKIELFNRLYEDISGKGIDNDTELAHVNKYEASVLRALGGSGTINPSTNLVQFLGGGGSSGGGGGGGQQHTSSTVQKNEIPEYFKPYALNMIETAEQVYESPYEAYTGDRLAAIAPTQSAAMTGMEQQYSQIDPATGEAVFFSPTEAGFERAGELAELGGQQFGEMAAGDFEAKYMSPYQQAVTDVRTTEAQRQGDIAAAQLATEANAAGAYGGSRHAILEAEQQRNLAQQLDQIQAVGSEQAYTAGQTALTADRAAALGASQQLGNLTPASQAASLTGLGALQTLGETQRAMEQQPIDIDYEEFVRQRQYPRKATQEYSSVIQGFPMQPSTYTTAQQYQQPPNLGQQLLQAGALYAGIAGGLGKIGGAGGGLVPSFAKGGLAPLAFAAGGPALVQLEHSRRMGEAAEAQRSANEALRRTMLGEGNRGTAPSQSRFERVMENLRRRGGGGQRIADEFKDLREGAKGLGRGLSATARGLGAAGAATGRGIGAVGRGIGTVGRAVGTAGAATGRGIAATGRGIGATARGLGTAGAAVGRGIGATARGLGTAYGATVAPVGRGLRRILTEKIPSRTPYEAVPESKVFRREGAIEATKKNLRIAEQDLARAEGSRSRLKPFGGKAKNESIRKLRDRVVDTKKLAKEARIARKGIGGWRMFVRGGLKLITTGGGTIPLASFLLMNPYGRALTVLGGGAAAYLNRDELFGIGEEIKKDVLQEDAIQSAVDSPPSAAADSPQSAVVRDNDMSSVYETIDRLRERE